MFNDKLFDNLKETWDGLPTLVQKQIIDALADRGIIIDPENPLLPDTEVAQGLFHNCPACMKSQQEYYCNLYCSPDQSDFLTVLETFEAEVGLGDNTEERLGVRKFEAQLPRSYTDKIYDSCKNVKQEWFSGQNVSSLIPVKGFKFQIFLFHATFKNSESSYHCQHYRSTLV